MSDLNDPRLLFAAERTLLAWSRTSLTLMDFSFLIERFGLFIRTLGITSEQYNQRGISFWMGIVYLVLGVSVVVLANVQYRRVLVRESPTNNLPNLWTNH